MTINFKPMLCERLKSGLSNDMFYNGKLLLNLDVSLS